MQVLDPPTAASLACGGFETTKNGKVWLHVASTFGGGTITMQKSIDRGTNWGTFYPDGVAETFTIETTKLYDLPGGWYFRVINDATADGTTCYVDGPHIRINVTAATTA